MSEVFSGGSAVAFHQGDARNVDLQRHFDAALMMFAVLGYQLWISFWNAQDLILSGQGRSPNSIKRQTRRPGTSWG